MRCRPCRRPINSTDRLRFRSLSTAFLGHNLNFDRLLELPRLPISCYYYTHPMSLRICGCHRDLLHNRESYSCSGPIMEVPAALLHCRPLHLRPDRPVTWFGEDTDYEHLL